MYLSNMNDLPDYLPGNPPQYGIKQEAPQFYQGDRISIPIEFTEDPSSYTLRAYLSDSLDAGCIVWVGVQNNGITSDKNGVYVNIKSSIARYIASGIYYLAVMGAKLQDIDNWTTLAQETISITPSAGSLTHASNQCIITSLPRPAPVVLPSSTIQWMEGANDHPATNPTDPHLPALYSGENGTFYRWSVVDQSWIAIVS